MSKRYIGRNYSFSIPEHGEVVDFQRDDDSTSTRLLVVRDSVQFRLNLQRVKTDLNAQQLAQTKFETCKSFTENIAPYAVTVGGFSGWSYRHLFVDGGKGVFVVDTIEIQVNQAVYQLQLMTKLENHQVGYQLFELVLGTLQFSN